MALLASPTRAAMSQKMVKKQLLLRLVVTL